MPIPGAKFRVKTTSSGKRIRLAFKSGDVVEAKNLDEPSKVHTPAEFSADRAKRRNSYKRRG